MPSWIRWVEGQESRLARAPRPGFASGAEFAVPKAVVDDWLADARALGIASIICLLGRDHLILYERTLPGGLLAYDEAAGFTVAHIGTADGQTHPFTPEQYAAASAAFAALPGPVLVHCSAGVDRTGRIIAHLLEQLSTA